MNVLAFDLGASSGRAVLGRLIDGRIETEEIHRFSNDPVQVGNHLHWDILRLYYEIKQGLLKAKLHCQNKGQTIASIGIDTWGVDFGLIGSDGQLLANPIHYRDHHTDGVMEQLQHQLTKETIFQHSGIQFLPFNTIYQLHALQQADAPMLKYAQELLLTPELLRYFLTGIKKSEFTIASTSQLLNPHTRIWDNVLLSKLGLRESLFQDVVQPGTIIGTLKPEIMDELGLSELSVVAVAEHDTASAVVAVPSVQEDFAYLSCGTWSLLGTEVKEPVLTAEALKLNFTNEGGAENTFRLLKNIMGLWLLQECKKAWELNGKTWTYPELINMAMVKPAFQSFVDPDDALFLNPANMPEAIAAYCKRTGQQVPEDEGAIVRCVLESLALKYRNALEQTELLSSKTFNGLHMVGGGIHNTLLCQWTANAIKRPVWAGPAEGSAMGNIAVQLIAQGKLKHIREARQIVRNSVEIKTYEPAEHTAWEQAYQRFLQVTETATP